MSSEKRRVVRGPRDAIKQNLPQKQSLPDYSQIVADSSTGTLADLIGDEDYGNISVLDQYPKLKRSNDSKVTIEAGPQYSKKQDQNAQESAPQGHQETRRTQIDQLLKKYSDANQLSSKRRRQIGGQATSIAFSNPAAAEVYRRGYDGYVNEPVSNITEGQKSAKQGQDITKGISSQASTDQDRDPNSNASKMAADYVFEQFGVRVPKGATAQDIKKTFPYIQADTKRDTTQRGQDYKFQTDTQNRHSRESEGGKNRYNRSQIAQGHDKAGVGRVIIGGVLGQDRAAAAGSSSGAQNTANSATIPHAYQGNKFLVNKPGIPPSKDRADDVTGVGGQSRKYTQALNQAIRLVQANKNRPNWSDQDWHILRSAMAAATQANVKARGNGVANGPDIAQAQREIGSATDPGIFVKGDLLAVLKHAASQTPRTYDAYADSQGFTISDKPSQISVSNGTGGTNSSKKPVNPALGSSANSIAGQYGFGPVTGGQTNPAQPVSDKVTFVMQNGTQIQMSRRGAEIQQSKGLGRIK